MVALTLLHGAQELGLSESQLRARFDRGVSPSAVLAGESEQPDPDDALFAVPAAGPDQAAVEVGRRLLGEAGELIASWEQAGHRFVAFFDDAYPQQLATAFDNPLVLFHAGTLADDFSSIAVVGSRQPSEQSTRFATALAGVSVVSGLARGIDRAAHQAALDAGGRTVAVIGTGLDRFYPLEHQTLQQRIAGEGLVVSQFPPGRDADQGRVPDA